MRRGLSAAMACGRRLFGHGSISRRRSPILGRFAPPAGHWWSLSVLSAWERRHSRPLPVPMVAAAIAHDRISQKNSKQDRPVGGQALPPPVYRSAPRPVRRERLTPGRELELIRRAQNGDQLARQEIIASVQPLIEHVAAQYE